MTGKHLIKLGIDECIDSIEFNLNGCTLSDTECNDWDYNYDAQTLVGPESFSEIENIHQAVSVILNYLDNN